MKSSSAAWRWLLWAGIAAVLIGLGFALDPLAVGWSADRVQADDLLRSLRSLFMPLGKAELPLTVAMLVGVAGRRRRAAAAVLAALLVAAVVGVGKPLVGRERPGGTEIGAFPSGDAALVSAVAVPLVAAQPAWWPVAGLAVAGVGSFRVLDAMHHPSDVVAGTVLGLAAGLLCWRWTRRRSRLPSWRWFAGGAGLGLALHVHGLVFGSSERFLSGLVVFLPPFLLVALTRVGLPASRRWRRRTSERAGVLAAALLALALSWTLAAGSSLWDRDEPRFARAAVEMLEAGDWLVPHFNGQLRPDKPILIYWLMATSLRVFGTGEWAVRLWSGLGLALTVVLTAGFARRRLAELDPVVVALVVALSPLAVAMGTAATVDGVLLAVVTASTVVAADACLGGWRWWRIVLLGGLLGVGLLLKGPVAPVVPCGVVLWWAVSEWRCGGMGWTRHLGALALALILGLGLFFAWALPANRATGGALAAAGLGHHVVARSLRPLEGHGGSLVLYLPFYPLVLLMGMLPWSAYLPAGLAALWRGQVLDAGRRRLLWGWILPLTALMTLVATKLPHYVLPVVPALAFVAALALHARAVGSSSLERWWDLGRWWLRLSGSLVAALLILGPWLQPLVAPRRFLVGMGLLVGAAVWQGTRLMGRRQQRPALALLALSGVLVAGQVRVLLPVVETAKPAPRLARAVRQATAAELPVWAAGFREPSLAFYLGRGFVELGRDEVAPWLASGREGVLITEAGLLPASLDPELELLARARGFNVAKGEWVDVVAVLRASGTP